MAVVRSALADWIVMDRPEYFIVRVYRRALGEAPEVEGVVEVVAMLTQQSFATSDELWAILLDPSAAQQRSRAASGECDQS